jgi:hypothetical protein
MTWAIDKVSLYEERRAFHVSSLVMKDASEEEEEEEEENKAFTYDALASERVSQYKLGKYSVEDKAHSSDWSQYDDREISNSEY